MVSNFALNLVFLTSVASFVLHTPLNGNRHGMSQRRVSLIIVKNRSIENDIVYIDMKLSDAKLSDKLYTFEKSAKVFAEAKVMFYV